MAQVISGCTSGVGGGVGRDRGGTRGVRDPWRQQSLNVGNGKAGHRVSTHPEALLISSILRTGDYQTALMRNIDKAKFHVYPNEWSFIDRFIRRYRKLPSKEMFKLKYPDFPMKSVDDVAYFSDEVLTEHTRFLLTETLDAAINHLDRGDVDEALKALGSDLINIQSQVLGDSGELDLMKDWEVMYDEVSRRVSTRENTGTAGLPTGFPTLDMLTGGPQAGDLWIMAARLGQGKTWTMIRVATAAFYAGHTVQYDALEQTTKQVGLRMHTFMSSKHGKHLFKSLDLAKGENVDLLKYKKFLQELDKGATGRMLISDQGRGRVTPLTIAAQIERNKPDIVLVDYITLMEAGERSWQDIARLSGDLKVLAGRYEVPIVCAAQINRTGDGKEPPKANALAQGDSIGQDADCVVTMAQQSRNVMKLRLAKYRNGQDGDMWYCKFTPNSGQYDEIDANKAQELIDSDLMDA